MIDNSNTISRFEQALISSMDWLREAQDELGHDEQDTYECLRTVLHALRDRLSPLEVAALGRQLPMVVRGAFYEGWTPDSSTCAQGDFLSDVAAALQRNGCSDADAQRVACGVLRVLGRRMPKEELNLVLETLPSEIKELLTS